jgi:hypothetical protein
MAITKQKLKNIALWLSENIFMSFFLVLGVFYGYAWAGNIFMFFTIFGTVVVGALLLGLIIGYLLNPQKGKETHKKIQSYYFTPYLLDLSVDILFLFIVVGAGWWVTGFFSLVSILLRFWIRQEVPDNQKTSEISSSQNRVNSLDKYISELSRTNDLLEQMSGKTIIKKSKSDTDDNILNADELNLN